jgi:hypothetical protein
MKEILTLTKKICSFGERQNRNLRLAVNFIENYLRNNNISFITSKYIAKIPHFKESKLIVDGILIESSPSGLTSGKIKTKHIINNLLEQKTDSKNINFNPKCKEISRMNFYKKPALTIKKSDTKKVKNSKNVSGHMIIKERKEIRKHIIIGNIKNPKTIIFTHLDSLGGSGATDNAVSNALILNIITNNRKILNSCLFVYDSCEELSLNEKNYWCYGYRVFEKNNTNILKNCDNILVLDGIGINTKISKNKKDIEIAFKINNETLLKKTTVFIENNSDYLKIGHSKLDTINKINTQDIAKIKKILLKNYLNK